VVQLFSTGGIFVGFAYLFLMTLILTTGIKLVLRSTADDLKISLAILSAWIGFQAQSLISIDNIGVSVWGWLLGGAILGLAQRKPSEVGEGGNAIGKPQLKKTVKINLFQPVISITILIPIVILTLNLSRVESNVLIVRNLANPSFTENKTTVLDYANRVLANPIADPSYKLRVSLALFDMGYKDQAVIEIEKLLRNDPRNLEYLQALIIFASRENNVEKVIELRNSLSSYDPWNAENYLELCKLYKFTGDLVKAKKMQEKIISFAPESDQAKSAIAELA